MNERSKAKQNETKINKWKSEENSVSLSLISSTEQNGMIICWKKINENRVKTREKNEKNLFQCKYIMDNGKQNERFLGKKTTTTTTTTMEK